MAGSAKSQVLLIQWFTTPNGRSQTELAGPAASGEVVCMMQGNPAYSLKLTSWKYDQIGSTVVSTCHFSPCLGSQNVSFCLIFTRQSARPRRFSSQPPP